MRAAVLSQAGEAPTLHEIDEPGPVDGGIAVTVSAAAVNPHDLVVAAGVNEPPPVPYVPGSEGVGRLDDGSRVYFGLTRTPHGSFAERAVAVADSVHNIPAELSDGAALAIGVAGVSAWLPLTWKANLQPGERVLVLGATGSVGQIAIQAARVLGAGHVVAAGRNRAVLDMLTERGADETVLLEGDYATALREASQGGFDLVVDMLFGAPMLAALPAIRIGGRLVNVGMRAGRTVELPGAALKGRDLLTYSANAPSAELRRAAYAAFARLVVAGEITAEFEKLALEQVAEAWKRQATSPNTKLVLVP